MSVRTALTATPLRLSHLVGEERCRPENFSDIADILAELPQADPICLMQQLLQLAVPPNHGQRHHLSCARTFLTELVRC